MPQTPEERAEIDRLIKEQRQADEIDGFVKVDSAGRIVPLNAPD
jgi:hypothetical protein